MTELILETADGHCPIEKIIKQISDWNATLHWTDTKRRIVTVVNGDFDDKQADAFVSILGHLLTLYLYRGRDASPLEDGHSQTFEGKPWTVEVLTDMASTLSPEEEEKGPEVPVGINFMGVVGTEEIGDVRPCNPAGFIQAYLEDRVNGLDRLAGVVGQFVVRHNDGFWVRNRDGAWTSTTKGAAIGRVKTEWRDELMLNGIRCTSAHLEALFHRSLLPVIEGTLTSPVRSDFVQWQGQVYLNLRLAPRLAPTTLGADGRLIRDFLLKNALNDQRPFADIEAELTNPEARTPTKWALNWFAHLYQRPGVALSTALWLISVQQGIGKSLTGGIMSELVGLRNAVNADQSEMTGEWSDWIVGSSLVVADEVNVTEKKSFYSRQKAWIGSRSISVRKRGVGQWSIPNIMNWMYLTNDLQPIRIDSADRRNMLIMSTNDLDQAMSVIESIKPILDDAKRFRAALAELGAWLDSIKIEDDLIRRAIDTELKDDLIEATRDAVESFVLDQVEIGAWKQGHFLTNDELRDRYFAWCDATSAFAGYRSQNHLRNGLVRLRARGMVDTKATKKARGWIIKNPPAQTVDDEADSVHEVVDFFRGDPVVKVKIIDRMRAKRAAEGKR
jgi:hypothetical protein